MDINEQVLKELLGHEYGPVVVTLMIVISLAVKIFPHITEFRKGKAKKIEQVLKSPNLSDDVKAYLQDKLMREYFYRVTGVSADVDNIKKIIAIHQDVRNDIVEADFRLARDYIKYSKSKIVAKLPNTFWYYATMSFLSLCLVFLILALGITWYGLPNIDSEKFQSIFFFIVLVMCFVDLVKKKYAYDSVKKIKQYLDENETHETQSISDKENTD
jgi:hypothetical protein